MFDERIAIALPSLAGYNLPEALAKAQELGFQSLMSFPGGPRTEHSQGTFATLGFYDATAAQQREIVEALAPFKHIAIHQAWDDEWQRWLACAAGVGAEVVTVHAREPRPGQSDHDYIAERAAYLRRLGDAAQRDGLRIGVENQGWRCDSYLALLAKCDHPCVGATLDLGHCASFEHVVATEDPAEHVIKINDTIRTIIRTVDDKLFSVHAHDVRHGDWRDHRCVGTGVIDFPGAFEQLREVSYKGLFEIELEEPDQEAAAVATGEYLAQQCRTLPAP